LWLLIFHTAGSIVPLNIQFELDLFLLLCSVKLAHDGDARLGQLTGQFAAAPGEIHTYVANFSCPPQIF